MDYRGHIRGGLVLLDDAVSLAEGTPVTVRVEPGSGGSPVGRALEKLAGSAELPAAIGEAGEPWRRFRALGDQLAATSVPGAASLTDAVSQMRR